MAASTVVIDIIANFKNKTSAGMNSAKQSTDRYIDSVKKAKRETDRLGGTNARPRVTIQDRATSALSKIDRGLKMADRVVKPAVKLMDYATKPLKAIKNTLFSVKGLLASVGLGISAAYAKTQLLDKPLQLADSYSSAKIGFSTLLGDTAGQQMMDDLDAFAKATPFKTSGVIDNAQKMLAMGWDAENIITDMKTIGDAAAATGKMDQGLESIVRALSQIKTKGKLSTEELNQLSEAGISAKAMLAEQLGYGTGDKGIAAMTKDLEKGLIGSEVAVQALLEGMKKFEGTMEKTANETVEGLKSQLEDTFEINILRKWGQGLQDGAKRGLGSILELLDKSEGSLEAFGETVYEVGKDLSNWAADKLEGTIDKILKVSESEEFKNASFGGKIKIMWDEVIAKPFGEWWDSKGKPFVAEKMSNFGEGLGSGMSKGLMALLGIDVIGLTGEASSIGGSFAQGFAKGFEGKKVWDAIVKAAGQALKSGFKSLFTGGALEKIIVGGLALKMTSGILSGISTVQTLWSGTGAVTGAGGATLAGMGLKGIIGSTGNSMVQGTGLLNLLANVGYGVSGGAATAGGYFGAGTAMTGGMAALTGAGALAGGALTGYGIYSMGKDIYTSIRTDDSTELGKTKKTAYGNSATLKGTGMATGAAIGAVLGGPLGALLGAGVGFVGGKLLGDVEVRKYKELEKTTEAAKYNSQEMKDAIMEGSASAEELDAIFQRACSEDMVNRFGDIELSMEEIEKYAKGIVLGDQSEVMDKFANSSQKAAQSLQTFHDAAEDMQRLNFDMAERQWKIDAGIDVKLSDEEIEEVKARVQNFMDSAEKALSDSHYEFNMAVDVLLKEGETKESIIETGNNLYRKLQKDLDSANKKLEAQYEIALKDGVITADEQKLISEYQKKVSEIIDKVSNAETEAAFEISKLKFTTGDLSADSFANLQSSLNTQLETYIGQQDVALQAAVSDVQLQMQQDPDNAEKYKQQIQDLVNGYNTNIESMKARVEKVQLEGISEAFDGAGTVEQLQSAISALTEEGKNPVDLTFSDINAHLDIDESSLSEEEKTNFTSVMKQALQSGLTGENALKPEAEVQAQLKTNEESLTTEASVVKKNALDALQNGVTGENALKPEADVQTKLKTNEETLTSETSVVRKTALDALQNGFTDPLNVNGKANLSLDWTITSGKTATVSVNGSSKTLTASLTKNANGGYIDKAIETIVGEAGPEMIIPLSSERRQRGKYLWERAGRAMGLWKDDNVIANANGGLYGFGSSRLGDMMDSATSAGSTHEAPSGSGDINVDVGGVHITIQSTGQGVQQDINADDIAGQIAEILQKAFQNMPITVGT